MKKEKESNTDIKNTSYLELLRTFAETKPKEILTLLDIIPIGVCVTDDQGIFVHVNQAYCDLYQYKREELIGNSFTMVVPDEWRARMQELHDLFMGKKYELQGKWDVVDKGGNAKKILSNAAYLPKSEYAGPRKMTFVVEADDTQQMLDDLEDAVKLLQKKIIAQDTALQMSSHDLRNNLVSILQIVEVLLDKQPTEEQKKWLDSLRQRSDDTLGLMKAVIDYGKMEQEEYEPVITEFDIITSLKKELDNLSRIIRHREINVSIHCQDGEADDQKVLIRGDKFYIQRMLHNLLLNAFEASSNRQKVGITIEHDSFLKIIIHNEEAIPDELRDTFFDKFATAGKKKGTGLGTYIAKLVVEMHNGSIAYRSSEEYGTDIIVLLPG